MEIKETEEIIEGIANFSEKLSNSLSEDIQEYTDTIEDDNAASIALCIMYTTIGAHTFAKGTVISEGFFNDFEYPKERLEGCLKHAREKLKEKINKKG